MSENVMGFILFVLTVHTFIYVLQSLLLFAFYLLGVFRTLDCLTINKDRYGKGEKRTNGWETGRIQETILAFEYFVNWLFWLF